MVHYRRRYTSAKRHNLSPLKKVLRTTIDNHHVGYIMLELSCQSTISCFTPYRQQLTNCCSTRVATSQLTRHLQTCIKIHCPEKVSGSQMGCKSSSIIIISLSQSLLVSRPEQRWEGLQSLTAVDGPITRLSHQHRLQYPPHLLAVCVLLSCSRGTICKLDVTSTNLEYARRSVLCPHSLSFSLPDFSERHSSIHVLS